MPHLLIFIEQLLKAYGCNSPINTHKNNGKKLNEKMFAHSNTVFEEIIRHAING
jgi:hypothetical protein